MRLLHLYVLMKLDMQINFMKGGSNIWKNCSGEGLTNFSRGLGIGRQYFFFIYICVDILFYKLNFEEEQIWGGINKTSLSGRPILGHDI